MVIFDGSIDEDTLSKEVKSIEELLKENADYEKVDMWGRRQLAYEIEGKRSGYYSLFVFSGDNTIVEKLEKHMKFNTNILRNMSVVRNPDKRTAKDIVEDENSEDTEDDSDE
jgi:small subunit ribosomal protein S6